jgi:hypothetical protein
VRSRAHRLGWRTVARVKNRSSTECSPYSAGEFGLSLVELLHSMAIGPRRVREATQAPTRFDEPAMHKAIKNFVDSPSKRDN